MIHTFHCVFGVPLELRLSERFGTRVELEALEFIGAAPIEWRINDGDWRPGLLSGQHDNLKAFHDLQVPVLGDAKVMVWLRDGTYAELDRCQFCSQILQIRGAHEVIRVATLRFARL